MNNPHDESNTPELPGFARKSALALRRGDCAATARTVRAAKKSLNFIGAVHKRGSRYAGQHVSIPRDIEWLLDNWYIAEREGKSAIAEFKALRTLPGVSRKRPLICEAARTFVLWTSTHKAEITSEDIHGFLDAFCDVMRLSEDELCAFIPAVRLEFIAALSDGCKRLCAFMDSGEPADGLADAFDMIFTSLRFLSGFDAAELLERVNRVERALLRDPAGLYGLMDDDTRRTYRRQIQRLARLHAVDEETAANYAVELSAPDSHVGRYIFSEPLGAAKKRATGSLYIGALVLMSLFLACFWALALTDRNLRFCFLSRFPT